MVETGRIFRRLGGILRGDFGVGEGCDGEGGKGCTVIVRGGLDFLPSAGGGEENTSSLLSSSMSVSAPGSE